MKPLTEQDIRLKLKKDENLRTLTVSRDTLVTPSAAEFMRMRQISLVYSDEPLPGDAQVPCPGGREFSVPGRRDAGEPGEGRVYYGPDGGILDRKGESMTHLQGNHLVYKDHPVIAWRGKLDTLNGLIIEAQELGMEKGNQEFVDDLQEILDFVRGLLPCEYKNQPVENFHLLGLNSEELRERSHNPRKYYGFSHILFDCRMGSLSIRLNRLRAAARETELAAAAAFRQGQTGAAREDIIEALNRLSSVFYILIYKYLPKDYSPKSAGI
jgi:ethanolamine utilization cobalamin adenosyltransferase